MATQIKEMREIEFRRFSAEEYHRMGDAGVFGEDERIELLDGFLIAMPPIGYRHENAVRTLANEIGYALGRQAVICTNSPIALAPNTEPQPDVAVLPAPLTRYRDRLPNAADVLLLVEVADSSRSIDRGPKMQMYARAGIEELWIVDLVAAEVLVLREPQGDGYRSTTVRRSGDRISPARFPTVVIDVSTLLGAAKT
jgi:Uma2 family endonuclease